MNSSDPCHLRALANAEILHEGPLSVRQNKGWIGLRRWLTRYYVICKSDWTLRRYKSIGEAERPTLAPRCLSLRDVDYIRADGASRFLITCVDGTEVKLAGEDSEDTRAWAGWTRPAGARRARASGLKPLSLHTPPSHPSRPLQESGCWPFRRRCACWRRRRTCRTQRPQRTSSARSCRSSLKCGRRPRPPAARAGAWAAQGAPRQQLPRRASTRRARLQRPTRLQRGQLAPFSPARPPCPLRCPLERASSQAAIVAAAASAPPWRLPLQR